MELDDLRRIWSKTDNEQETINTNIMDLVRSNTYGPFVALKRRFRKQVAIIVLAVAMLVNSLSRNHEIFTDVLFWCYIICCIALCVSFYLNYRLVTDMQRMDSMIKTNLERQVAILENRLKKQRIVVRIMMVFFIILSELLPFFDKEPMLDKWHTIALPIRIAVYAGLLLFQYFVGKLLWRRKYGQHVSYIKSMLREMQP